MSDYYVVKYELWPTYEPDEDDLGRHTDLSIYEANSSLNAVNAVLHYVRGRKSQFEMAHVHNVYGPFKRKSEAREVQYE
jgi:hypothetical protein